MMTQVSSTRFILISGKPVNENIVQYGSFVMNRSYDYAMEK